MAFGRGLTVNVLLLWYTYLVLVVTLPAEAVRASPGGRSQPGQDASHELIMKPGHKLSILLVTGFFPGHLYPIAALGAELVKRGHNVTLCATVMEGSNLLPDLPESYGINFVSAGPDNLTQADYDEMVRGFQNATILYLMKSLSIGQWPMIKVRSKIDELGVEQFDFIVSDLSVNAVGLYYACLGRKVMIFSPMFTHFDATIPEWPSPPISTGLSDDLTFLTRMISVIGHRFMQAFQTTVFSGLKNFDKAFHKLDDVRVYDYFGIRIPLVIASAFGFGYPKTRFPLTHYVGPLMMDSFTPLEQQLLEWLSNKPNKTVIYFGMGASGFITPHTAQLIIDGILATDFNVVWALPMSDQDVLEGIDIDRRRFYVSKWIPRQTLFKHPTLVMTILHCAMNSVQESLYNGLPVVCVPHGFDHFDVARRVDSAKVGIPLYSMMDSLRQRNKFNSENLTIAIKTITETKEYSEETNKIRKIFKFAGGVKRAADLVEFYSEVGYDHLIPAYAKYEWSWVQYYNVDVYCVLSLLGCLLFYVFYQSLKCCCKCFCSKAKKPKSD